MIVATTIPEEYLYQFRHTGGDNPCGEIAVYHTFLLQDHDLIDARDFMLTDGTVPENDTYMRCGFCGKRINIASPYLFSSPGWEPDVTQEKRAEEK